MKKLLCVALGLLVLSCNKQDVKEDFKTAYVDTDKLMEKYQKATDLENKYKIKSEEMGRELETEAKKFQQDYANAQRQAQAKGPQWAQQKGFEFQEREQKLNTKQQSMSQELQRESGVEMDSLVTEIKTFIKDYGKTKSYDYVYGTGSTVTVLYAKDKYDITEELVKLLNANYKTLDKKEVLKAAEEKK
ncbi:OmpH family outer membrane protein [uncultured Flavobacterium sp.]|uniref:OmpH family outer membrane protein n=1 Tax=uncultured Flavobacterium sp. TaxID=165435 RepID=UPI0030CA130B|tara:strand:- start:65 stop:631 length:567 start_codon:yes stop_codon:yes gene_type:complete